MKIERYCSTSMNSGPKKSINEYQAAMISMIANKILIDYIAISNLIVVEPEHYVEEWMLRHLDKPDEDFKEAIWHCFMVNLIACRREENK